MFNALVSSNATNACLVSVPDTALGVTSVEAKFQCCSKCCCLLSQTGQWPVQVLSLGQPGDMEARQTSGNGKEGPTDPREKQHVATPVARHFKSLTALWGPFCFDINCGQ